MKTQLNKSEQAFYTKLVTDTMSKFNLTAEEASNRIKENMGAKPIHKRLDIIVELLNKVK